MDRGRSALAKRYALCTASVCGAGDAAWTAVVSGAASDMHSWQDWQVRSLEVVGAALSSSVAGSCIAPALTAICSIMGQSAGMAPVVACCEAAPLFAAMWSAMRSAVHPRRGSTAISKMRRKVRVTWLG